MNNNYREYPITVTVQVGNEIAELTGMCMFDNLHPKHKMIVKSMQERGIEVAERMLRRKAGGIISHSISLDKSGNYSYAFNYE